MSLQIVIADGSLATRNSGQGSLAQQLGMAARCCGSPPGAKLWLGVIIRFTSLFPACFSLFHACKLAC